ncbi:winged helix-turn-helix transcriptional regulator [Candidatus Poribacteria bacterium]|nr:winged helix-turn-helix transcriptional regulator [Candidatus Poribacteria bacterium]
MEKQKENKIYELHAEICKILANPKRLQILNLLRNKEMSVNELASLLEIREANVSQHLTVMRQKGILVARREGVNIYYRIANPKVIKACDIMREVLLEQLEERAQLVEDIQV